MPDNQDKPTLDDLIAEVRKLAAEHPDNVYTRSEVERTCTYHSGGCQDGSVGCIFGQAARNLGMPWEGNEPIQVRIEKVWGITLGGFDRDTHYKVRWCQDVQSEQDEASTWADAIKAADGSRPI